MSSIEQQNQEQNNGEQSREENQVGQGPPPQQQQQQIDVIVISDGEEEEEAALKSAIQKADVMVSGKICCICFSETASLYDLNGHVKKVLKMHELACCKNLVHPNCFLMLEEKSDTLLCPMCRNPKIILPKNEKELTSVNPNQDLIDPYDYISFEIHNMYEYSYPMQILAKQVKTKIIHLLSSLN